MLRGLLVGRFQPFHLGHLSAVEHALGMVDLLWLVIGSAQKSHEPKNPFTAGERLEMIKRALDARGIDPRRWHAVPVYDADVHYLWVAQVNMLVPRYDIVLTNDPFTGMLFREHGREVREVPLLNRGELSGTEVRRRIAMDGEWRILVPEQVAAVIDAVDGARRVKMLHAMHDGHGGRYAHRHDG
ncbi:MAG: nicotinamide-nucleotide adenylyltransferase [Candidatus Nitrosocaldus sp.]|nr:nicotinamide-nucleotide adenylyltransferase [Candidatus Nitrosocaldus sp.]MCS7141710.1 nicotinamide-nucleotide adenylyltransferase [Candidatus Nitrosocaldus sp.]MDW8000728.1 nicotinamide-nucleotide adenylyltransferase [Candidatus Nitrosocaldus sp.]MDW8276169.1 nicotinamide-nucleotide adenylyltransferase [Candidatus Nitrosocaldus sp.]